jgi:hypothetical protein
MRGKRLRAKRGRGLAYRDERTALQVQEKQGREGPSSG